MRFLPRYGPPFEREATFTGYYVLRSAATNEANIESGVTRIKRGMLFCLQLISDLFDSRNESGRTKDCRRSAGRVSAMSFVTSDKYFCQAITLSGAHGLQRSWFADNAVARPQCLAVSQTLCTY